MSLAGAESPHSLPPLRPGEFAKNHGGTRNKSVNLWGIGQKQTPGTVEEPGVVLRFRRDLWTPNPARKGGGDHSSRSLASKRQSLATESSRPCADDFKHGFHLEVGDPPKPTDRSPDSSKAKPCFDLLTPGPQGQRRRVVAIYEVGPGSEHIRTCGMSGYPSLQMTNLSRGRRERLCPNSKTK